MVRTTATNFSGGLQFPYATSATDVFHKEDVQTLAQAVDQHDHTAGKGVTVPISTSANLLANGSFEIWQRGAGPFSSGQYGPDRWQLGAGGGSTIAVTKETTTVDTGFGSSTSAKIVSTIAGGNVYLVQACKISDNYQLRGRLVTASLRVNSSVAGTVTVTATADGTGAPNISSPHNSSAGTWQTLAVSITVPVDATQVMIYVLIDTTSCTAYIDNAMLVIGNQAAAYVPLHPADDLARCLRYYESSTDTMLAGGYCTSTTVAEAVYKYLALKGGTPTITLAAASSFQFRVSGSTVTCATVASFFPGRGSVLLNPTVGSGLVAGQATTLTATGADAVKVEWNP